MPEPRSLNERYRDILDYYGVTDRREELISDLVSATQAMVAQSAALAAQQPTVHDALWFLFGDIVERRDA